MEGIKAFSESLKSVFGKDTFTEDELTQEFYTTLYISCDEFFRTDDNAINLELFWSENVKHYLLEPKEDGIPVSWNKTE